MAVKRRGQANISSVLTGVFVVLLVIIVFVILFGYMKETVAPELGLNETLPQVTGVIDKAFKISNLASTLLILIVVFSLLMIVIAYLTRRAE